MLEYVKSLISKDDPASTKNAGFLSTVLALIVALFVELFLMGFMKMNLEVLFTATLTALVGLVTLHKD